MKQVLKIAIWLSVLYSSFAKDIGDEFFTSRGKRSPDNLDEEFYISRGKKIEINLLFLAFPSNTFILGRRSGDIGDEFFSGRGKRSNDIGDEFYISRGKKRSGDIDDEFFTSRGKRSDIGDEFFTSRGKKSTDSKRAGDIGEEFFTSRGKRSFIENDLGTIVNRIANPPKRQFLPPNVSLFYLIKILLSKAERQCFISRF